MNKKGQLAIFVIVAILIVAAIVLFFVFREKIIPGSGTTPDGSAQIVEAIQNCLDSTLEDSITLMGLQGGYTTGIDQTSHVETNDSIIAYGYYLGRNSLPTLDTIQKQISDYLELIMPICFSSLSNNQNVLVKDIRATTSIGKDAISSKVNFPVSITKNNVTANLDKVYSSIFEIKFKEIYSLANEMIAKEKDEPGILDISYLTSKDYNIFVLTSGEDIIYVINQKLSDSGNYQFRFANRL